MNSKVILKKQVKSHETYDPSTAFTLTKEDSYSLTRLNPGEILVKVKCLSIDAAMRVWISGIRTYRPPVKEGELMPSAGLGEVILSNSENHKIGDLVYGELNWQGYAKVKGKSVTKLPSTYPIVSHFLSVYGVAGLTAYFGMKRIGKPEENDTIVVSAAAGGVGVYAIQLAKIWGSNVVGIAGSDEKCKFVVEELGANACLNYKDPKFEEKLKEKCPDGVDVYFDNVGGKILDSVLKVINERASIVGCGVISNYDGGKPTPSREYMRLILKKAKYEGFIFTDYYKDFPEAIAEMMEFVKEKKMKVYEDTFMGLEKAPDALHSLINGKNKGKVIVQLKEDPINERNVLKPSL